MRGRLSSARWRRVVVLGVALYTAFLLAAPFEHHDLVCHLKNPIHCTSCSSSLPGSDPQAPASLGATNLDDAGRAVAIHILAEGTFLAVRTTGRSPPASMSL